MDASRIEAAAKAAWPMYWPEDLDQYTAEERAAFTHHRQAAIETINRVVESLEETKPKDELNAAPMPEDAAMLLQQLIIFTYLDENGTTATGVRTIGEGLLTTWLGMAELAKHFLMRKQAGGWKDRE